MFRKLTKGREAGFTLVEVLVVVLILGVLAAIVTISVSNGRDKAIQKACVVAANQLKAAIDLYYVDSGGTYPGGATTTRAFTRSELSTALVPGYMAALPTIGSTVAGDRDATGKDYYLSASLVAGTSGNYVKVTGWKANDLTLGFPPLPALPADQTSCIRP